MSDKTKQSENTPATEADNQQQAQDGLFSDEMLPPPDVGKVLVAARKKRRLTLKRIARDLNIRETYLEALEENRFEDLPGKAYISGFLRSYCSYLDVDHQELVDRLHSAGVLQEDLTENPPTPVEEGIIPKRWILASGVVLLVVVAVGVGILFSLPDYEDAVEMNVSPVVNDEMVTRADKAVKAGHAQPDERFESPESIAQKAETTSGSPKPPAKTDASQGEQVKTSATAPTEKEMVLTKPANEAKPTTPSTSADETKTKAQPETSKQEEQSATANTAEETRQIAQTQAEQSTVSAVNDKPAEARIRFIATDEVWFQVRHPASERVYVSEVLQDGQSYWLKPWDDVVLDVGKPQALEVEIDGKNYGVAGIIDRRVRGLELEPDMLIAEYFGPGINLTPTVKEVKTAEEPATRKPSPTNEQEAKSAESLQQEGSSRGSSVVEEETLVVPEDIEKQAESVASEILGLAE